MRTSRKVGPQPAVISRALLAAQAFSSQIDICYPSEGVKCRFGMRTAIGKADGEKDERREERPAPSTKKEAAEATSLQKH